jgi:hypothetical protein
VPRPREDLLRAFDIQGRHLKASCDAYDAGDKCEALRLATIVFTMVHDAGTNRSILGLLDIKYKMFFMSSAFTSGSEVRGHAERYTPLVEYERYREVRQKNPGLTIIPEFVPISTYMANRGKQPFFRELPFEDWWETDLIFFDQEWALTRKKLVFVLRNQEGGSHFDGREGANPNFIALRKDVIMATPGLGVGLMNGLELATMRQIAEELKISVQIYQRIATWKLQHGQAA